MRTLHPKWNKIQPNTFIHGVVLTTVFGVIIGWVAGQELLAELILFSITTLLTLVLYLTVWEGKILTFQRILLYLTIIAGFTGSAFFAVPVGPIHIFPYRVLLAILWFVLVIQILAGRGKIDVSNIKGNRYLQFYWIWLIYAVFSTAWAASKGAAIKDIMFLFMAVSVILFVAYYFSNGKDLKRIYYLWLAVFYAFLLLGIWENLTGQHLLVSNLYGETRTRFMFRPTGLFYNTNDYATFLALSAPFSFSASRYARNILFRLIGLGGSALAFYLIIITGSRANILAVLLELGVLAVLLTKRNQKVYVTVALAICLAMGLMFLHGPIQDFFSQVSGELSSLFTQAELNTGSVAIRTNLVRNGLVFLYSSVGMGVGAGNAEYWMANFPKYNTLGIINLHNWWLEILVNYGVLIFIGYALMYTKIIRNLWSLWNTAKDRRERMITESLLTALVGFFFASVSPSSVMAFKPQWFLFAFALAFINWRQFP